MGKSNGQASLELWIHYLKDVSFLNYSSSGYTVLAVEAGASIQFSGAYKAAAKHGMRVRGGYCPSIGLAGGYVQGGGHGPLAASYGLATDNTLEFVVVPVDGKHQVASPSKNSDLYLALSGGGGGNYAVIISMMTKAHSNGPIAAGSNAVLPAWRDALYTLNIGIRFDADASPMELQQVQAKLTPWQALFEPLTPGGGPYMGEATFDYPNWKKDYFAKNYDRLLGVKKKYGPKFALWQHTLVGADA
ncbi:MAG: hypothetical protein Q9184_004810 [Pyrenodesmia sp. 2 TL-2023]